MTKPSIVIVAGTCGLLVIGLAVKQFRGSRPSPVAPPQRTVLPEAATTERGGWIARPEAESAPAGGAPGRSGGLPASNKPAAAVTHNRSSGVVAPGAARAGGGGAAVVTGGKAPDRVSSGVNPLPAGSAASGRIEASTSVAAADVSFEGALPLSRQAREERFGRGGTTEIARAGMDTAGDNPNTQNDENGPVLSLPFYNSTQPEKGDTAVFEQGVTFETGEGATFATDSQFIVPNGGNIQGEKGTVSFWLQPQWGGGDEGDASLVQLRDQDAWENRLQIFKNGRYLRFLFTDNTGQERNVAATLDNWTPGEWHHVTGTWGDTLQSLYVDGRLIGQQTYAGQLDVRPGTPLYIGSDLPRGGPSAGGTLSNFQVYNRVLPPDEVSNLASSRR